MALSAGLDFLFATDHYTIEQKSECRQPGLWWGQEPSMGGHHLALLASEAAFEPGDDGAAENLRRAREISPFCFIPHPAGWWPKKWYTDEQVQELDALEEPFAIEVINAANKHDRAYDQYDAAAVNLWDRLLTMGRRVTGLGASDAHMPQAIGSVWTAVLPSDGGKDVELEHVLQALRLGHCFASEGPLVNLTCETGGMGDTVEAEPEAKIRFELAAAYRPGLHAVSLVSQGKSVADWRCQEREEFRQSFELEVGSKPAYLRIQARGTDDRRAFGNPIYISPA
jgi:hypothetical protein